MDDISETIEAPASARMGGADPMGDQAVIVALGCNDKGAWPDCRTALEAAVGRFPDEGITIVARSGWWASKAWPDPDDPPFLNGVAVVSTELDPHDLMSALARIEQALGRTRRAMNAPRTLDLDLIVYGRETGDCDGLILPHPRAADRAFVMRPLAEIAPDWRHPVSGDTAAALANTATVGVDASLAFPAGR